MTTLNCLNCNSLITTAENLTIYSQSLTCSHLTIKLEKRNAVLNKILLNEPEKQKKNKFVKSTFLCKKCNNKIGLETLVGPNSEAMLCFRAEAISLGGSRFEKSPKWIELKSIYQDIEIRDPETLYGLENAVSSLLQCKVKKKFIETVFPDHNEISKFNISSIISDKPRKYQIELYISALCSNTVVYLQTGGGKTLVAAMITAYMKKINPNKKIFFVTDRIPLVFQQAEYLRYQTGLTVGEFCGENKEIMESQLQNDVLVFTVGFLNNIIFNKMIYLEDCCCLIIDEMHHAKNGHQFVRLIEDYHDKIEPKYRPRIVGLTASPSSSSKNESEMKREISRLCVLIQGNIAMSIKYQNELNEIVNRSSLCFKQISSNPDNLNVKNNILELIKKVFTKVNIHIDDKNLSINTLKSLIDKCFIDCKNKKDLRDFSVIGFLKKLVNSLEILDILGITSSGLFIKSCIEEEKKANLKSKSWSDDEINKMADFLSSISKFSGNSEKLDFICNLLNNEKSNFDQNSKLLIFVRSRKTARFVCDFLCEDKKIKAEWNPRIFVGHANGQIDGMSWYEEQEPTLISFRENKCRLLVATNVLQEGLDVPECDNVILFDLIWTLTQYIQSKGRSRRENSKFIVIGTAEEKVYFEQLVELEKKLMDLIPKMVQKSSDFDKILSSQIEILDSNYVDKNKKLKYETNAKNVSKLVLQIHLEDNADLDYNLNKLRTILRKCIGFQQSEISKKLLSNLNLFEKTKTIKCLFQLKSLEKIEYFLQIANFLIQNCKFNFLINPVTFKSNFSTNPKLQVMCEEFEFGNLITPFLFCNCSKSFNNVKFIIQYEMKNILVLCFIQEDLYKFEISFDSIDQIIVLSNNEESLDVFVPTKRLPFAYTLIKTEDQSVTQANFMNFEEEFLAWERIIYDSDFSYHFKFGVKDKADVINSLKCISHQQIFFTSVSSTKINYSIEDFRREFKSFNFAISYSLECFISQCQYFIKGKICKQFVKILNSLKIDILGIILEKLTFNLGSYRYCNILNALETIINDVSTSEPNFINSEKNFALIRRVTVCPSRIIFHFPEPCFFNRITREFKEENFIRVKFRDEDLNKLNMSQNFSEMSKLYSRIENFLLNGLKIAGIKYEFLAMSSSQMREHACWLFINKNDLNADLVRKWMGDFSNIKCIGKLAARLGQSLSASTATFATDQIEIIPDIEVGGYNFSDGIGKISKEKVDELCNKYLKISNASTFQIRFRGFKGVVALDPNLTDKQLQFRNSMNKFDCRNYHRLDVLNVADYIPCYLNRQVILILSSLGIEDKSFESLLDQHLQQISSSLMEDHIANEWLLQYFRPIVSMRVETFELKYKFEPYFRNLLVTIHQKLLQDLINKSRIFVPKGRILMGAIDETGSLKEDEIFIQCTHGIFDTIKTYEGTINDNNSKMFIVNTKVAIAKNPCMHPGDLRTLNAINNPRLSHLVNCVVFPSVGSRPITNMCSGSDLDGDLYFVTWDPTLVPSQLEKPMKYDSVKAIEQNEPIKIKQIIKFFVDFIKVDQLGRIANTHVAISDISPKGVKDPDCITLAKIFSKAVDFPKTGLVVEFPSEIKGIKKYPDFMEKKGPWYFSNKIIGKMYRKTKRLASSYLETDVLINPSFVIKGHKNFLEKAIETFSKYRQEIERIMRFFECKNESELFVGFNLSSNEKSYEAMKEFKNSSEIIRKLWDKMRQIFTIELKSEIPIGSDKIANENLAKMKASAWYVACYASKNNKCPQILSFPWIVEDVLNKIPFKNYDFFSKSIVENYLERRDDFQSMSRFIQKIELRNELAQQIGEKNIFLIGFFGLFLFDKRNTIQLYIYKPKKSVFEICESLKAFYDSVSITSDDCIKCYKNEYHDFVLNTCEASFRRFAYMKQIIHKHPSILPFLFSIIHFGSNNGIFKVLVSDNIKLDNFVEFCIQFYLKENSWNDLNDLEIDEYLKDLYTIKNNQELIDEWIYFHDQLDEYVKNANNFCENNLGKNLLNFYRKNALNSNKIIFQSKFENILEMSEFRSDELKNHFLNIFNTLSKTLNIKRVWETIINSEEDFPVFRSRLNMMRKSKANSANLFVENASIFTLSNYYTDLDQVEFEPYKGKRRSLHLEKSCWSVSINRDLQTFTKECESEIYLHILKQITKAKEVKQNYKFKFQIKFGNVYFTNIPSIFLEESCSVPLFKLRNALRKGYKMYSVDVENGDQYLVEENLVNKKAEIIEEDDNDDKEDENEKKSKEKKETVIKGKSKLLQNKAFSAFDSNIDKEIFDLNLNFVKSEFDSALSEAYIVYLELKNAYDQIKYYRIKYSSNFELTQIEKMRIKWISADIRNTLNMKSKDIRFSLESNEIVSPNESHLEFDPVLSEKIKNCVFKIVNNEIKVDESFRDLNIFIKHSRRMKYFGGIESWHSIFNLVKLKLPETFPIYLLEKIKFSTQDSLEFTENNQQGYFTVKSERKEFTVQLGIDIKTITNSESKDVVIALWFIAQVFSKLLAE